MSPTKKQKTEKNGTKTKPIIWHSLYCASTPPVQLIYELGKEHEYDIQDLGPDYKKTIRTAEYSEKNPLLCVPYYEEDGEGMIESGAIFMHILHQHKHKLVPKHLETKLTEMAFFASSTLYYVIDTLMEQEGLPKEDQQPNVMKKWSDKKKACLEFLTRELGDSEYFYGDSYTAIDLVLTYAMMGMQMIAGGLKDFPKLEAWLERASERPSFKKATAADSSEGKVE